MTSTSPSISFGIGYVVATKQDSVPSMANLQLFSNINDLRTDNATNRPYASYEPDFWLLDGGYKFLPGSGGNINYESVHIGIMNATQSNGSSNFVTPPVLTIAFGEVHDIDGLTLRFAQYSNDFADSLDIEFYDALDVIIGTPWACAPDSWEYNLELETPITDVKKIIIRFYSTNKPYRYLRMTGIDYGRMVVFTGAQIREASVVEETHPLSIELRSNIFDVKIHSESAQFSPINPGGDYYSLAERQPIAVYEQIGNWSKFIGQFYLDEWENTSDTEIDFHCVDILTILGEITYLGGIWLGDGIQVEDLLDEMLTPLHVPYDLDTSLYGTVIKGWIPISTYREALQQIAFAIGAYVDSSRDRPLKIYPTVLASAETDYDILITKAMKGIDQAISLRPIVTGVEITAHDIVVGAGSLELYNGYLAVGTHEIRFKQPCHYLTVTGATITTSGANYAILTVATAGTVTLNGKVYTDTRKKYSIYTGGLSSAVMPNIIQIEEATLVNSANAQTIAQRVYDYYQQRLVQRAKLYAEDVHCGNIVAVDTLHGQQIRGIVEKVDIDLAMGMIENIEAVGVKI